MSSATGLWAPAGERAALHSGMEAPRIRIEQVIPSIDNGALPAKGIVGQSIVVEADIYMDGHDQLAARLIWRGPGTLEEQSVPMVPLGNDRWRAEFVPARTGRHRFNVEAWLDDWASYRHDLGRKKLAGNLEPVDIEDGRRRLLAAVQQVPPRTRDALPGGAWLVQQLEAAEAFDALELLLSDAGLGADGAAAAAELRDGAAGRPDSRCRTAGGRLCKLVRAVSALAVARSRAGTALSTM